MGATIANGSLLSTGRMNLVAIDMEAGTLCTSITFYSLTTALSGGTAQWFALYDSARALLRQTVDDTNVAWGATAAKTLALTSTFRTTYTGLHYLGIMVAASTVPSLSCIATGAIIPSIAPIMGGTSDTGLTTTAPANAAAITYQSAQPYAHVN